MHIMPQLLLYLEMQKKKKKICGQQKNMRTKTSLVFTQKL